MNSTPFTAPVIATVAAATVAALAYWLFWCHREDAPPRAGWIKTASTALLALAALLGANNGAAPGAAPGAIPGAIVIGLALGSAGDYALSRPGNRWFLAGMVAFALGHLAYAVAFAQRYAGGPAPALVVPAVVAVALLLVLTVLWIAPRAGPLCQAVRLYALVISAMTLSAAAMAPGPGIALVQGGVAAFVASDLILSLRLFVLQAPAQKRLAARLLWPLYWGGQAMILWGMMMTG